MRGLLLALALVAAFPGVAAAAPPLRLEPGPAGPPVEDYRAPGELHNRYVFTGDDSRLFVRDDVLGRDYAVARPPACSVYDIAGAEALLRCAPAAGSFSATPATLDLVTGAVQTFAVAADTAPATGYGFRAGETFDTLGTQWIAGGFLTLFGFNALYVNRATGQRREFDLPPGTLDPNTADLRSPPRGCAASPTLNPAAKTWLDFAYPRTRPPEALYLYRCGKPRKLLSTCKRGCLDQTFTARYIAWSDNDGVHVLSRRTGGRYLFKSRASRVTGLTPRRLLVTTRAAGLTVRPRQIPLP